MQQRKEMKQIKVSINKDRVISLENSLAGIEKGQRDNWPFTVETDYNNTNKAIRDIRLFNVDENKKYFNEWPDATRSTDWAQCFSI